MQNITLLLADNEVAAVHAIAREFWPTLELRRHWSESECIRRLLLASIDILRKTPRDERARALDSRSHHLQPPADSHPNPRDGSARRVDSRNDVVRAE